MVQCERTSQAIENALAEVSKGERAAQAQIVRHQLRGRAWDSDDGNEPARYSKSDALWT